MLFRSALQRLKRHADALASFRDAIALNPAFTDAWLNLAGLLRELRRFDESIKAFSAALKISPSDAELLQARAEVYADIGETDLAMSDLEHALHLKPGNANSMWARSFIELSTGNFQSGFDLFEYRFRQTKTPAKFFQTRRPLWTPTYKRSRVLIWSEQGLGDEIFFSRWLRFCSNIADSALIAVDGRMIPIYELSFPTLQFIRKDLIPDRSDYDCHLPMGSLPKATSELKIDWRETIQSSYLKIDESDVLDIKAKLNAPANRRIVGLTWKSERPGLGAAKSVSLQEMLPILRVPNCIFVNLQYGDCTEDLARIESEHGITILTVRDVNNKDDLPSHAALLQCCDSLVLTCNATAHLAGAMGVAGRVLAPKGNSQLWYWLYRHNQRPFWYPSLKVFDQDLTLTWEKPIDRLATEMKCADFATLVGPK